MPLIHTGLNFNRFVKQVSYGPGAVLGTYAMAEANAVALQQSIWKAVDESISEIPPLNFTTNPASEAFDAYKYASDYADGKQKVYAGAVAYKIKLPADAFGADDVVGVTVRLHVDRWLIGGARIAAYLSDDELPDEDWTTCREGDVYEDAVLPATNPRSDQQADVELLFPASSTATKYLYIVLSLEDLQSVSPLDVRRLEGGAQLVGILTAVEFDADVAADTVSPKTFLAVAAWRDATDYFYSHLLEALTTGTASPKGWWAAIQQSSMFWHPVTDASNTTEIGLKRLSASSTVYRSYGMFHSRFTRVAIPTTLKSLSFANAIPAPSTGVVIHLVVYASKNQAWAKAGGSPSYYRWDSVGTPASSYTGRAALMRGTATTLKIIDSGGTDTADITIEKILDIEITKGYSAGFEFPISLAVNDSLQIHIAASVSRIIGTPGETVDTLYGISWKPGDVTLKANENEPV